MKFDREKEAKRFARAAEAALADAADQARKAERARAAGRLAAASTYEMNHDEATARGAVYGRLQRFKSEDDLVRQLRELHAHPPKGFSTIFNPARFPETFVATIEELLRRYASGGN